MTNAPLTTVLPGRRPDDPARNLLLYAVRQMGANGVDDAMVAQAYLTAFGKNFRRPLLLTRTLMLELAGTAIRPIAIAPPCCGRMTACEGVMLDVLARAATQPAAAGLLLADMLGVREAGGALASAAALAAAFHDLGLPLSG